MKEEFLHPRFEGARFEEHTLPLDVARDLAAYEVLVVELAKRLYLEDHPKRKRVPKGFESAFHLHLQRVDDGSTRPLLSVVTAGALALSGGTSDYFEQARDLVTECIASADGTLPARFPKDLLRHFNQVGRSLRPGECMEIPRAGGDNARLTSDKRKRLVIAAQGYYLEEVELAGMVEAVSWKKDKEMFQLRLPNGSVMDVAMPNFFRQRAGEYGGRDRVQVSVRGVGTFDHHSTLQEVVKVRSVDVQPDYQIAAQLDAIGSLLDGWHNGHGIAPDPDALAAVYESLVGQYPETLPLPTIVPTQEGNLLFEWPLPGDPSLDVRLGDWTADFHAFGEGNTDVEQSFRLATPEDWKELWSLLDRHRKGEVA